MNKFDQLMTHLISSMNNTDISNIYSNIASGKRIRPKLITSIAGESELSFKLGVVIELIHMASLLHDDVIDESMTRRGQESINSKYDNKTSIMMGDILYSKAFYELCSFNKNIAQTVSNAVNLLSIGELEDMRLSETFNTDKDKYISMIYKKTASLIEASCKSAALLCGDDVEAHALYGKNLGLAFQIVDDILDITQSSETLGKPNMSDFRDGKVTLPYLIAYEKSSLTTQTKLISLFKKHLNDEENRWIQELFEKTDSINESYKYAQDLVGIALKGITNEKLHTLMNKVLKRKF